MKTPRDLVFLSLLLGVAIILQAVEAMYLPPLMIPGAKLGIANLVTLLLVAFYGWRQALVNVALRVTIVGLITGTFMSTTFVYSLLGGIISALVMAGFFRLLFGPFSFVGVSLAGALAHNLTQLALARIIIAHPGVIYFLPWLIFMAVVGGLPNGLAANLLAPKLAWFQE